MKKAVCILLAAAILLVCVSMTAAAADTKISDSLQMKIAEMPDNAKIEAHIWLYCPIDKEAVFRQAIKECGYIGGLPLDMTIEEVHAYRAVYNRIVSEQEAAVANSFIEKLGIADEDIVYHGKHNYIAANLTKAQILDADTCAEVESIGCDSGVISESPTELLSVNTTDPPTEPEYLFRGQFEELCEGMDILDYRELYSHYDENGDLDWVLVYGVTNLINPMELYTEIAHRALYLGNYCTPFDTGYGVYDVKAERFKDARTAAGEDYGDFDEVFDQYGGGRLLGDVDNDNEISIIDTTILQRCGAMMRDYPEDDEITLRFTGGQRYYSDFNRDGERDILDATCIQRYLVGLPYPTGK